MPNVEVAVTYETITSVDISPGFPSNRSNSLAVQHIDTMYAQTKVYRFSADPLPLTTNVWFLLAAAGGAGAGNLNGPTRPGGWGGPTYGVSGGGGGGGVYSDNVTLSYGTSYSVSIGTGSPGSAGSGGPSSISGPGLNVSLTGGGGSGGGSNSGGQPGGSGGAPNGPAGTGVGSNVAGVFNSVPQRVGNPSGCCGGGFIALGAGGGGFAGAGGGAAIYFGGVGGGGLSSPISGSSISFGAGGWGGGDSRGFAGGGQNTGGGGGAGDYAGRNGVAYFSYPSTAPIGNGGANIYLTADNRRVHQFTASGTFTLGPPPNIPDGRVVTANANETIRVTRLTVHNYDTTNLTCNVYYRKEAAASNSFICFNRPIPRDSVLTVIDSSNVVYVSNLDSIVLYCQNIA